MNILKLTFKTWLPFAVTITAFCALGYGLVQQAYRQGANDPQIQMAEDAADSLTDGARLDSIVPASKVSVAKSLAPFFIVYDVNGLETASSVFLDGKTPELPAGVLESSKELGENRFTWQPRDGIRIAAVIVHYKDGYVLARRNLREVEIRESQVTTFAGITLFLTLVTTLIVIALGEWLLVYKN